MNTKTFFMTLSLITGLALAAGPHKAVAAENDKPAVATHPISPAAVKGSGLPLPRFASMRAHKTHVRSGPGARYPIRWVYNKSGTPVEIVQEFENWRKIRDFDGDGGWVNQLLLSGKRTVEIRADAPVPMRSNHKPDSRLTAKLEPHVVATLKKCDGGWCRVQAGGYDGWVERNFLWGIYAHEDLN
jgi:SH3-like domain-containing protein